LLLFGWAWPCTSVIDIVAGAYYMTAYLYGSIKARVNPIATFLASLVDLTGFLSGMTRQMRFTVIDKT
jgi:hypothetical protein